MAGGFVQHVHPIWNESGRAAVVLPDNVLFEGSRGEDPLRVVVQMRRAYSSPWPPPATKETWVYDLRSSRNFLLRQNPIRSEDLADFVVSYRSDGRNRRAESVRFHRLDMPR